MTGRAARQYQDDRAGLLASGGRPRGRTIGRGDPSPAAGLGRPPLTWSALSFSSCSICIITIIYLFCSILFSAPIFRLATRLLLQEIRIHRNAMDGCLAFFLSFLPDEPLLYSKRERWWCMVWSCLIRRRQHNSTACQLNYRICAAIKKKRSQFTAKKKKRIPLLRKCQRLTMMVLPVPVQVHQSSKTFSKRHNIDISTYTQDNISPGKGAFPVYEYLIF
jgi:hypothetical protein